MLTINLSGRIDANNAGIVEEEISSQLAKFPNETPVFDAENLSYISSAGLRVLLKAGKKYSEKLNVINASDDVYNIFEVTGFTELFNVRKKFREISVEGCPVIGEGFSAVVYRLDSDTVAKVFSKFSLTLDAIMAGQKSAREAFIRGIPTAITYDVVRVGKYFGVVYEMAGAETLAETVKKNPARLGELSEKAGRLLREIHSVEFEPGTFPDAVEIWRKGVETVYEHDAISLNERDMLNKILDRIPIRNTFIHNDYHPNNIMLQGDELMLIDIADAALGYPAIDFSSLHFLAIEIAPMMKRTGRSVEEVIGLPDDMLHGFWYGILRGYFGTDDGAKLQDYTRALGDYSVMRAVMSVAKRVNEPNFERIKMGMSPFIARIPEVFDRFKPIEGI